MAELAGETMSAALDLSVDDDRVAKSCTKGDEHSVADASGDPHLQLSLSRTVRVVVDVNRNGDLGDETVAYGQLTDIDQIGCETHSTVKIKLARKPEPGRIDRTCDRHELADHLPNVLGLLARLADAELIDELVREIIAPAVNKMIDEFAVKRIKEKNQSYEKHYKTLIETPAANVEAATLYKFTLKCLLEVLKADFGVAEQIPVIATSDFLRSVSNENEIEEKAQSFY